MWWADKGKNTPCCQFADEDEIDADPERYDCQTCAVSTHLADLWPENVDAWRLWNRIASRTVVDLHLGPWMVEALTAGYGTDEKLALIERFDMIRAILSPPETHGHAHPQDRR